MNFSAKKLLAEGSPAFRRRNPARTPGELRAGNAGIKVITEGGDTQAGWDLYKRPGCCATRDHIVAPPMPAAAVSERHCA